MRVVEIAQVLGLFVLLMSNMQGRPLAEAGRAVTSYHPPSGQVTANHNNHPIFLANHAQSQSDPGTLTGPQVTLAIDDLGPGDEGEYACKAENPWGDTTCTLLVGGFSIAPLIKTFFHTNTACLGRVYL